MSFLQLILINIISNLDNIPISIVSKKINKKSSFIVSLLSSIILLIIMLLKRHIFQLNLINIINIISSLAIIVIGLGGLLSIDKIEHSNTNLFSIALGLSLNNIAVYLSIKDFTYTYSYLYPILNLIFCYIFFIIGIKIKKKINCRILNLLSSILLCIIGIINLIISI